MRLPTFSRQTETGTTDADDPTVAGSSSNPVRDQRDATVSEPTDATTTHWTGPANGDSGSTDAARPAAGAVPTQSTGAADRTEPMSRFVPSDRTGGPVTDSDTATLPPARTATDARTDTESRTAQDASVAAGAPVAGAVGTAEHSETDRRAATDRRLHGDEARDAGPAVTGTGDRPADRPATTGDRAAVGPKPRASLLATLGLIFGVAAALLVLSGPLLGYGIGVAVLALVLSFAGIHATGRRHVAGKTDALIGMVLALGAIVVGVLALTGSLSWLGTDMQPVGSLREWLDTQFVDRF